MAEESAVLQEVREYRRQRDSGMAAEGEEGRWKYDGELLHNAVEEGEVEVVQYLVEEAGVSVEVAGRYGWRPLHLAARYGRLAVGRYLVLEGGADMEAETEADGTRPLHLAALNGYHAFVEMMLEQGASADAEIRYGNRLLHLAAGRGHPSVVRCLLQRRAGRIDVNAQNHDGNTALHLTASAGFGSYDDVEERALEVVRLLVEEGEADPLLRNKDGKRASDRAKDNGLDEVQRYLLEAEERTEMQKQA